MNEIDDPGGSGFFELVEQPAQRHLVQRSLAIGERRTLLDDVDCRDRHRPGATTGKYVERVANTARRRLRLGVVRCDWSCGFDHGLSQLALDLLVANRLLLDVLGEERAHEGCSFGFVHRGAFRVVTGCEVLGELACRRVAVVRIDLEGAVEHLPQRYRYGVETRQVELALANVE